MVPFAISIAALSLVQAALIAVPRARRLPAPLGSISGRWWALLPPASIIVVIVVIDALPGSAGTFTYLALFTVPPLAALALAHLVRGARPRLAWFVAPLFAAAWAWSETLAGHAAALALSALACVSLGWLLASIVAPRWLRLGIYAMAAVDTWLVVTDLLQGPNSVLTAASPGAGLPRLQVASFGAAVMGFGDLFVAATLGALLVRRPRIQTRAAVICAAVGLLFDLLFFAVDELPATVPVALTLALIELGDRRDERAR
jgi:hypothetical protein